jgi:hypothetical protein
LLRINALPWLEASSRSASSAADIADGAGSAAWMEIRRKAAATMARAKNGFKNEDMFQDELARIDQFALLSSGLQSHARV